MKARRTLVLAGAIATALAATAASGGADTGTAKAAGKRCPDGYLCVWEDANYQGHKTKIKKRKLSHKLFDNNGPLNDTASSLKLRKSGTAVLYADANGQGAFRCFDDVEHRNVPDLADPAWNFDNTASSSRITKGPPPCMSRKAARATKGWRSR
jgi:hypothetical protein